MSDDSSIKRINLTGTAAASMATGIPMPVDTAPARGGGGRSRKQKKKLELPSITKVGGGATSGGTLTQLTVAKGFPALGDAPVDGAPAAVAAGQAPAPVGAPTVLQSAGAAGAAGPTAHSKPVKVVLTAGKKKTHKVVLAKGKPHVAASVSGAAASTPAHKTRRVTRKVRVSVSGLSKKLTKAKTIRHSAAKHSVEHIKRILHKAGLVRTDTKAPETILRQMYADYMMLKQKAL